MTTICVTGHRPERLGGHNARGGTRLRNLCVPVLSEIRPERVITGMALGFDIAIAQACEALHIPFVAAVPFRGQESRWPESSQRIYRDMLAAAASVVYVSEGGYSAYKMIIRNEWMVVNSDSVLALWDGSSDSGTGRTVAFACAQQKYVTNIWPRWMTLGGT